VKFLSQPPFHSAIMRIRECSLKAFYEINSERSADDFMLVLVTTDEDAVETLLKRIRTGASSSPQYPVSIGILTDEGSYREVSRLNSSSVTIPDVGNQQR